MSSPPPPEQLSPPPASPLVAMLHYAISPGARVTMFITCLVLIAALQYPLLLSLFRKSGNGIIDPSEIEQWNGGGEIERTKILAALSALSKYKTRMAETFSKKRKEYNKLKPHQKLLLASTIKFVPKITHAQRTLTTNEIVARAVFDHGCRHYNVTQFELRTYEKTRKNAGDHTQTVQALKHFVRDWSEEGEFERAASFPQLLETMGKLFAAGGERVLVPGAGLGRLSYELAARGFEVTANEFSPYMLLAHRYMLSLNSGNRAAKPNMHSFHPHINWWSHQKTTESLLRSISFPDMVPDAKALKRLRIVEGDFVTSFLPHEEGGFDAVVSLFFIDTARNLVDYLETIYKVIKPGGYWVNLGPLLYGTAPLVELSLDEVLRVSERLGFELVPIGESWGEDSFPGVPKWAGKVRGGLAGYSWDRASLTRNAYLAQGWVARKI